MEGVAQCALAPSEEDGRTIMLVAYVVLKEGVGKGMGTTSAIKKQLGQSLQKYMIPQKIVYLPELPFNTNGKVDRFRLKEMSKITK